LGDIFQKQKKEGSRSKGAEGYGLREGVRGIALRKGVPNQLSVINSLKQFHGFFTWIQEDIRAQKIMRGFLPKKNRRPYVFKGGGELIGEVYTSERRSPELKVEWGRNVPGWREEIYSKDKTIEDDRGGEGPTYRKTQLATN